MLAASCPGLDPAIEWFAPAPLPVLEVDAAEAKPREALFKLATSFSTEASSSLPWSCLTNKLCSAEFVWVFTAETEDNAFELPSCACAVATASVAGLGNCGSDCGVV